jgi:hypothetical protein
MKRNKYKIEELLMDEDISFQSPGMTTEQKKENLSAFGNYRQKNKEKISNEDKLRLRLLRLKFQIDTFLNARQSD